MLRLEGRACIVIGGGTVANRKVESLLLAGARVTVIAPMFSPSLETLATEGKIAIRRERYAPGRLAALHPLLVFAATDDVATNQQVAAEARSLGALVNIVDAGESGDFTNMSVIQRENIIIGISTNGASPALASHLRDRLESFIGKEYGTLARWMSENRDEVKTEIETQTERAALWRSILDSPVLETLRQVDEAAARALFDQLIDASGEENS